MNEQEKTALSNASAELADDVQLVVKVVSALKAKNKTELLSLAPQVFSEIKQDVAAFKPIFSMAKGFKTSEFILIVLLAVFNAFSIYKTGAPLAFDFNATFGGLVGLYTLVRGGLKAKTPQ